MTDADLTSERVEEWLASIGTVSEEIARMVWAFPDDGRRELVRALALRVAQMERELEQLRRDAARDLPAPSAVCDCGHTRAFHPAFGCIGKNPDFTSCGCSLFKERA